MKKLIPFSEWADFGHKEKKQEVESELDEMPIDPIDCDIIINELMKIQLGNKLPSQRFEDVVQWGNDFGAVKIDISPLGSYKVITRRKIKDINGEAVWICKNIMPFTENQHNKNEIALAEELIKHLAEIDNTLVETADMDSSNFEKLVLALKTELFQNYPSYCMFPKGIKKNNEDYYTIYFEARGAGNGAPDSRRLEQFNVEIIRNKERGLYRSFGHDISVTQRQSWEVQISEWDEWFSPRQKIKEIVECISAAFSTY